MFLGTTTAPVRNFMAKELATLKPAKVYEPFAGIFMLSQICGKVSKDIEIESTDVSLFSAVIGLGLNPNPPSNHARLTPLAVEMVPYWAGKKSAEDLACAAVFFLEYALAFKKKDKPFYNRMLTDLTKNAETYHKDIYKKFAALKEAIGKNFNFRGMDACKLLEETQPGDVVFYDPPFISGDYEKMFAELPKWIDMPAIPYTEIDEQLKDKQLQWLHDRGCTVYYRDHRDREIDNYEMRFKAEYKYNGWFYIYSNRKDENLLQRKSRITENPKTKYPMLWLTDEITKNSKVAMIPCDRSTANHYRLLWIKKAEIRDMSGASFIIAIDGKVAGILIIASGMTFGHDYGLIVADTTSSFSKYKRLSKLILKMTMTKEFADTLQKKFRWPVNGFTTIAYSDKNYSSKYRGLMEKIKTEENATGLRYKLTYSTQKITTPTIRAAFMEWFQKYGNEVKEMSYASVTKDD